MLSGLNLIEQTTEAILNLNRNDSEALRTAIAQELATLLRRDRHYLVSQLQGAFGACHSCSQFNALRQDIDAILLDDLTLSAQIPGDHLNLPDRSAHHRNEQPLQGGSRNDVDIKPNHPIL